MPSVTSGMVNDLVELSPSAQLNVLVTPVKSAGAVAVPLPVRTCTVIAPTLPPVRETVTVASTSFSLLVKLSALKFRRP